NLEGGPRAELGPTGIPLSGGEPLVLGWPQNWLRYPPISVVNGAGKALGARLEVTLPAEVSLVSISAANAICSGTDVLRCDFSELDANSTATVNLSVRANARGSYSSALKLTSINDTNPANDSRSVAFEITAAAPPAEAKASGGGGGGGRLEWRGLAMRALLVGQRTKTGTEQGGLPPPA